MGKIVEVNDLTKTFYTKDGEIRVLDHINFHVEEGEIFSLLGPSGSCLLYTSYWYDKFAVFVSVLPTGAVFTRALYETSTSLAVPGCNAFVKFNPDAKSPV